MKRHKRLDFFPEFITLLLLLNSFTLFAGEKETNQLLEKNFNSVLMSKGKTKFKLSELSSPYVIVNFWASWCIPCLEEIPSLIKLSEKYKNGELSVVMINTDEENQEKNIAKIKEKFHFPSSFIVVPDKKFEIADQFKFSAIPVTIIYKKSKVHFFSNGPVDFSKINLD